MNAILDFKNLDIVDKENCLIGDELRERMNEFNEKLMKQISLVALQESEDDVTIQIILNKFYLRSYNIILRSLLHTLLRL